MSGIPRDDPRRRARDQTHPVRTNPSPPPSLPHGMMRHLSSATEHNPLVRRARARVSPARAVSRRGFTVRAGSTDDDSVEIALKVEGMMCDGCASSVTEALTGASPDVSSVDVNLETKMVTVAVKAESAVAGLTLMPALVDAVKGAGFDAEPEF